MSIFKAIKDSIRARFNKDDQAFENKVKEVALGRYLIRNIPEQLSNFTKHHADISVLAQLIQLYPELREELNTLHADKCVSTDIIRYLGSLNDQLGQPVIIEGGGKLNMEEWLNVWHTIGQHVAHNKIAAELPHIKKHIQLKNSTEYYTSAFHNRSSLGTLISQFSPISAEKHASKQWTSSPIAILLEILPVFSIVGGLLGCIQMAKSVIIDGSIWQLAGGIAIETLAIAAAWGYSRYDRVEKLVNNKAIGEHLVQNAPTSWTAVDTHASASAAYLRGVLMADNDRYSSLSANPKELLVANLANLSVDDFMTAMPAPGSIDVLLTQQYFSKKPATVELHVKNPVATRVPIQESL